MASVISRGLRQASALPLRTMALAASGGLAATAVILANPTQFAPRPLLTTAKCMCRGPPNSSCRAPLPEDPSEVAADLMNRVETLYSYGHLTEIYELLNRDTKTSSDPKLLFHLARATYKLGITSPLPGRQKVLNDEALLYIGKAMQLNIAESKTKADIHSLYAIVLQNRGAKKSGAERRKFYEAAKSHLEAALKEDRTNFYANYAFAEMYYEMAKLTKQEVKTPSFLSAFSFSNSQDVPRQQHDAAWKSMARHAQRALMTNPSDIQSMNLLAQRCGSRSAGSGRFMVEAEAPKNMLLPLCFKVAVQILARFAVGNMPEAKRWTVMAQNRAHAAKFADERKAARESKELMDKINKHFRDAKPE